MMTETGEKLEKLAKTCVYLITTILTNFTDIAYCDIVCVGITVEIYS